MENQSDGATWNEGEWKIIQLMNRLQQENSEAIEQEISALPLFTERENRLIKNCIAYAKNDPAGLPGHNLMIIVAKLAVGRTEDSR
jgi:hypothetical protein